MSTLTVSTNAGPGVIVTYDGTTTPPEPAPLCRFDYGAGGSLGNLLASVIGAEVSLETKDKVHAPSFLQHTK